METVTASHRIAEARVTREPLEQLRQHVTTLVDVDVDALDDDELDRLVVGVQRERERLAAVEAMLLSRWDSRQVWAADYETVLFDGASTVVSVSHRRTFTGALRRAIQVRDRRCQHPSECDQPVDRCDVDHIVPASRGGPTSLANGRLLCSTHNRHPDRRDASPVTAVVTPAHAGPRERSVARLEAIRARLRWSLERVPPPS